jgi:lipopolysaccharide transport system permease protein
MAMMVPPSSIHHIQVRSDVVSSPIDLPEILRHWDLLVTLADRDVRVRYKQTALGVVWVILQPLLASVIFAFIFGVLAHLGTSGKAPYLLFAFIGLTAWNTFAQTLTRVSHSLVSNAPMVSKVYFPRLILPLSSVASTLIDFLISLATIFVMLAFYRIWPGPGVLLLPVWLAILLSMAMGLGLFASALMVKYRDVGHLLPTFLQLGLFASPVAWSTQVVPAKYQWVFLVNPITGLLGAFRWSLLGEGSLSLPALAYSTATAALLFWFGARVFKQQERNFADVI